MQLDYGQANLEVTSVTLQKCMLSDDGQLEVWKDKNA